MGYDISQKSVLIIDDFYQFRRSLRHMVEQLAPASVDEAGNAKEALEMVEDGAYDIFLCDYNLGTGMDGQELHDELVHLGKIKPSTIFIMVTAEDTAAMVLASIVFEPDEYLTKPFGMPVLRQRLERIIRRMETFEAIHRAMELKDFSEAIALCDQLIQKRSRWAMSAVKLKTQLLMDIGRYDEAARIFEKVINQRPMPWALLGLGRSFFYQADYSNAKDRFERAIAYNQSFLPAYDWLAKTLMVVGDMGAAQDVLERAVRISPKAVERQLALAQVAEENGDPDTRIKAYRTAVREARYNRHNSPEHYIQFARSLVEEIENGKSLTEKRRTDEARRNIKQMRKDFKNDIESTFRGDLCSADLLEKEGKDKEAEYTRKSALETAENLGEFTKPDTLIELADAYHKDGQPEKADAMLEKLSNKFEVNDRIQRKANKLQQGRNVMHSQELASERNAEGVHLFKEQNYAESAEMFLQALNLEKRNISYALNAAQSLYELAVQESDFRKARRAGQTLQQASEIQTDDYRFERYSKLKNQIEALENKLMQ